MLPITSRHSLQRVGQEGKSCGTPRGQRQQLQSSPLLRQGQGRFTNMMEQSSMPMVLNLWVETAVGVMYQMYTLVRYSGKIIVTREQQNNFLVVVSSQHEEHENHCPESI